MTTVDTNHLARCEYCRTALPTALAECEREACRVLAAQRDRAFRSGGAG